MEMPSTLCHRLAVCCWLLALLSVPVRADVVKTPPSLAGVIVVSAQQARDLMSSGVRIFDVRAPYEFVEEHIVGAISLPYREKSAKQANFNAGLDTFALERLPQNPTDPVIFYCNAGECWKSYKACKAALGAGYRSIYWLRGGIPEWKRKGLPVE